MDFEDWCIVLFTMCLWILRVAVIVGLIVAGIYLINWGFVILGIFAFFITFTFILYWLIYLFTDWE